MSTRNLSGAGVLLAVAALTAAMSGLTPLLFDDMMFASFYLDFNDSSHTFSWDAIERFTAYMRGIDNGRLANILAPLFAVIPSWRAVFPYMTGCVWALAIYLSTRLWLGKSPGWRALSVTALAMLVFLPWRDKIFLADYSLNYIYSAAITLSLMTVMLHGARNGFTPHTLLGAILLAALCGAWHEGFSLPAACGFAGVAVRRRMRMPWQWYAVPAVLVAVSGLVLWCPGMTGRFSQQAGDLNAVNFKLLFDMAPFTALCLTVAFIAAAGSRWRRKLITAAGGDVFVLLAVTALAGTVLSIMVRHTPRSSFWSDICSVTALAYLANAMLPTMHRGWQNTAGSAALLLYCLLMVHIIGWQHRFYIEDAAIRSKIDASADGMVFHDIIDPDAMPVTTLLIPSKSAWVDPFNYQCLSMYYGKNIRVSPTFLKEWVSADEIQMIRNTVVSSIPLPVDEVTGVIVTAKQRDNPGYVSYDACAVNVYHGNRFAAACVIYHRLPTAGIDKIVGLRLKEE